MPFVFGDAGIFQHSPFPSTLECLWPGDPQPHPRAAAALLRFSPLTILKQYFNKRKNPAISSGKSKPAVK